MRIAISSFSGAGVTTACRKVSEALGLEIANYTFHTLAEELGQTFEKVHADAESHPEYDYLIDRGQMRKAESSPNCIVGSRLACWLIPSANLFVWIDASPEVRARRIAERENGEFSSVLSYTNKRDEANLARYKRLYGIDMRDNGWMDLRINSDHLNADAIAGIIIAAAKSAGPERKNPFSEMMRKVIDANLKK
jgi:CMP/dCMP kinase